MLLSKAGLMHGEFDKTFAEKKNWRVDAGLSRAVLVAFHDYGAIVDVGAGKGAYVGWLLEKGFNAIGYDGIDDIEELSGGLVRQLDLTSTDPMPDSYSGGMCIEVGEHIPGEHIPQFLANLSSLVLHRLMISWAVIGQRGRRHVSCHQPEWVAANLYPFGWRINEELTIDVRRVAGKGWDRKLMVLERWT